MADFGKGFILYKLSKYLNEFYEVLLYLNSAFVKEVVVENVQQVVNIFSELNKYPSLFRLLLAKPVSEASRDKQNLQDV